MSIKFKFGDIIVKIDAGSNMYGHHFTVNKEYIVLEGEYFGENYVETDNGRIFKLYNHHFNLSPRQQRQETIEEILK